MSSYREKESGLVVCIDCRFRMSLGDLGLLDHGLASLNLDYGTEYKSICYKEY